MMLLILIIMEELVVEQQVLAQLEQVPQEVVLVVLVQLIQ
tara:strand:+ start:481 stop:600 length:120 start_codon:yes stop_codon:yes gene_type:complete